MKVLIIEDELPAARQLGKLLLTQRPNFQLLDTLDSVEGAVRWLKNQPPPDLIFMDIQIADGLSFDIFRQVDVTTPVVFTTAFDQYAVQAFRVNAIDYLLKPVDPEELSRALQKVEQQSDSTLVDIGKLTQFFAKTTYKERFLIKTGQHYIFLPTTEIAFFRSDSGLTQAFTLPGKKHFVDHTLEELERQVSPTDFFRISRNMLVAASAIAKIHPHFNGRLKLDLHVSAPEEVFVSRDRAGEFKSWLGG